ncbi:hypothetical protein H4R19_004607 [Coemansia spiralis]|nr:hypothetical protein H4R19_004607 [Coemansia spiralis]
MARLTTGCCAVVLLLLAGWLYLSPDGSGDGPPSGDDGRRAFEAEWWERFRRLSFAHNSTFAQFPPSVQAAAGALLSRKHGAVEHPDDIAGIYRGPWRARHVSRPDDTLPDDGYARPGDAAAGSLALTLRARPSARDAVWLVSGTAQLYAAMGGYAAELGVQGLYWQANGTAVLFAAPEISAQTAADVVLGAPNAEVFAQAQAVYDESLGGRLLSYTRPEDARRGCGYHLYTRFGGGGGGVSGGLRLEAVMAAPSCGVLVATPPGRPAPGIAAAAYGQKTALYALAALVVLLVQAALLVGQMRHTSTPAGLSLVSYPALAMQLVLDCYAFIPNVLAAMSLDRLYAMYTAIAVLVYMLAMAPSMHYLAVVWHTQCPAAAAAAALTGPSSGRARGELWRIYLRFYAVLVPGVYAIYTFADTRTVVSGWLLAVLLAAAYSYWIPQIWRNAAVGSARGLRLRFVCGTTLARLFFPLYFLVCPANIALAAPSRLAWLLAAFSLAQAAVLVMQRMLGPRFFIPPSLRPAVHDYQATLPPPGGDGDLETGAGHTCAICLAPVDDNAAAAESPAPASPPPHAITPCRHIYHQECLARWMGIKLECPVCRSPLPPTQDP